MEACVNSSELKRQVVAEEGKKGDNSLSFHVVCFVSNTDYKLESTGNEGTYNLDSSFVVDPSYDKDLKKGILDVTDSFDSFRKMTDFYFPLDFEDPLCQTLTFFDFYANHDEQVARTFLCCCSDSQSSHQAYF